MVYLQLVGSEKKAKGKNKGKSAKGQKGMGMHKRYRTHSQKRRIEEETRQDHVDYARLSCVFLIYSFFLFC
jgi:hypothetical protein